MRRAVHTREPWARGGEPPAEHQAHGGWRLRGQGSPHPTSRALAASLVSQWLPRVTGVYRGRECEPGA